MLKFDQVSVAYGDRTVVQSFSATVRAGEWWMIIGPNGAGKSSLVQALGQQLDYQGAIYLGDQELSQFSPRERAGWLGILSQHHTAVYDFTVRELVSLGRYRQGRGWLNRLTARDQGVIEQILQQTGLTDLADQYITQLSGGELQRAFLAQVFAQDPLILVLDEPTNHLDLKYQQIIFDLVADWLATPGRAVVSVMHDLSLARRYGQWAALMRDGETLASGAIETVMTPGRLRAAYDLDVYQWFQDQGKAWDFSAR